MQIFIVRVVIIDYNQICNQTFSSQNRKEIRNITLVVSFFQTLLWETATIK